MNVDVAAATDRGIPVVNTPGKNAEAVAELTIAFALLLIRTVPRASSDLLRRGTFAESVFEGSEYFGREAASVTLGLVGLGRVGHEVATRAQALGFTVLAYDPLVTEAPDGVGLVPLDTLLDRSDVVSLHARATAENRHMFSREHVHPDASRGVFHQHGPRVAGRRDRSQRGVGGRNSGGRGTGCAGTAGAQRPASPAGRAERAGHPAHRRGHGGDADPRRAAARWPRWPAW